MTHGQFCSAAAEEVSGSRCSPVPCWSNACVSRRDFAVTSMILAGNIVFFWTLECTLNVGYIFGQNGAVVEASVPSTSVPAALVEFRAYPRRLCTVWTDTARLGMV